MRRGIARLLQRRRLRWQQLWHKDWTQEGELWDEAGSCLYDGDEDDVWECIDDALDDWLDDNMRSGDDYNDLDDEEEDTRGFTLEDYENDLDDVGNQPYTPSHSSATAHTCASGTRVPAYIPAFPPSGTAAPQWHAVS